MFEKYEKYVVVNGIVVCINRIYVLFFEERAFLYHNFIKNSVDFASYIRYT